MQLYADLCIRAWEKAAVLAKREDVGVFGCKLRSVKPITEFEKMSNILSNIFCSDPPYSIRTGLYDAENL
ncbi:hypothetical protein [Drancourtella sp. An12]|uniref:hypothetical protein n=1 Tax=Drancourtella sp. An12 TaxID=1965548 RepID=UPI0013A61E04|nr:hypothetical protein [Drancourtella sp. An12]